METPEEELTRLRAEVAEAKGRLSRDVRAANAARRAKAERVARQIADTIPYVYDREHTNAQAIAWRLMWEGIATPRGGMIWRGNQVVRLLRRAGVWK